MATNSHKRAPDAPESNAGDDFHILWTIRKALNLLNLKDNITKAIFVEGPTPSEAEVLDEFGDKLLGIDVAEYLNEESFAEASGVIFSQLKYSTRNPEQQWTLARLCQGKRKKYSGSIISRLASVYLTYINKYGKGLVEEKLKLKLVSNQKASTSLLKFIEDFKIVLNSSPDLLTFKKSEEYTLIKKASSLNEDMLYSFIKLLDLQDCGTLNRHDQKDLIDMEISKLNFTESEDQYNRLHTMVWNKMLPQSRGRNRITKEDILHCFKCNSSEDLFPAPSSFESNLNIIAREQLTEISDLIISSKEFICLHAGAGMGKSTIARSLPEYLPEGSIAVLFDCYGGGSYSFPSDKRHKHEWALIQICNELAILAGTPLLLQWKESSEVYLREFKKRLQLCAEIVASKNDEAVVMIMIDAADNSVTASLNDKSETFVHDIIKEKFPEKCKIVLTSRTHRVESLNLTQHWKKFEINRFTLSESAYHLAKFFPEASESEILEFHQLTKAVPRVQSYALSTLDLGLQAVLQPLKPFGKDLEDIMADQIASGILKNGEENLTNKILSLLITLPRPVPQNYLIGIAGCTSQFLEDLSTDLWKGIIYEHGFFSFRDEDYENFLRSKYHSDSSMNNEIAEFFLLNARNDEYASASLATILITARKFTELYDLVLHRKLLNFPIDPIRNKEVYIERTMLAMKYSQDISTDRLIFQKLQIIAAEEAKTDKVLRELLIANAELTATYGDIKTIQNIYFQSEENSWYGPVHFKSAAIFSRKPESHSLAKKYLKSAESWIDWRGRLTDEEMREYPLTAYDLSFGAEAHLRLYGLERAIKWIRRWQTREYMLGVVVSVINNIIIKTDQIQIKKWLDSTFVRTDIKILINYYFITHGIKPFYNIETLFNDLYFLIKQAKNIPDNFFSKIIGLYEYSCHFGIRHELLQNVLTKLTPKLPVHSPKFYDNEYSNADRQTMDIHFRVAYCNSTFKNTALAIEDFYPVELKLIHSEKNKKEIEAQKKKKAEFNRTYKYLLDLYKLRADFFFGKTREDVLFMNIGSVCASLKKDNEYNYYDQHNTQHIYTFFADKLIDFLPSVVDKERLINLLKDVLANGKKNEITLRIALAKRASTIEQCFKNAIILLDEIDTILSLSTMSGTSKIDNYVTLTSIGNTMDEKLGKYYFDKIIEAASDIDITAFNKIRCISRLAKLGMPDSDPSLAYAFANYVEYCKERLDDYENFPWDEAIVGVSRIDCSSGFSTLCRWDHKNLIEFQKYSLSVLTTSLEKDYLDVVTVSSLLSIYQYYSEDFDGLLNLIFSKYNHANLIIEKNIFLTTLIKDIKLNCPQYRAQGILSNILKHIKDDNSIPDKIITEFYEYLIFLESLNEKETGHDRLTIKSKHHDNHNIGQYNIDLSSSHSIEEAIIKLISGSDRFSVRMEIDHLLEVLKADCSPSQFADHLEAITNIREDYLTFWSFEKAISERLKDWDYHFEVREWKRRSFEKVLKIWLHHFIYNDYLHISKFLEFGNLFGISKSGISEVVQKIIPEFIDTLSGEVLYQFLELTAISNTTAQNKALVNWSIGRWSMNIDHSLTDGPWGANMMPPETGNTTIGFTIRYLLGNPDKKVRWRAVHAVRRLIRVGRTEIISFLLDNQNETKCKAFQYDKYTFYWMSSQLWLWMIIKKVIESDYNALLFIAPKIIDSTVNSSLDHILLSYFKKEVCLKLIEFQPSLFKEDELSYIKKLLVSQFKPFEEKTRPYNGYEERPEREKLKFDFDHMDTLPYWYQNLGGFFGLSAYDIALMADKIIADEWGYIGDVYKDNHVVSGHNYGRSKSHGDIPQVEDLQTYYEYHAMFAVAEVLLKSKRMVKQPHYRKELVEWIEGYSLAWGNHWLSDLRDATPLEKRFWTSDISKENWHTTIELDTFEKQLDLSNKEDEYFAVKGSYSWYQGKDRESFHFTSALVSVKTGDSLFHALQTANNSHDYKLPLERESDDFEINDRPFILKGWLKDNSYLNRGIDSDDPFSKDWIKHGSLFGINFCNWLGLEITDNFKRYYKKENPNETIGRFETWSDVSKNRSYGEFESEGQRLKIKKSVLLDYLKYKNASLIMEATLSKWKDGGHNDMGSHHDSAKLFLINSDGTIKSYSGSHQLR